MEAENLPDEFDAVILGTGKRTDYKNIVNVKTGLSNL